MPTRYLLYYVYAVLFLYKARSYGVLIDSGEKSFQQIILETIDILRRASVSPQDAASRYARLLELLWNKPPRSAPVAAGLSAHHRTESQHSGSLSMDAGGYMQFSPANDFSWLDLEAVGDFVSMPSEQLTGVNMLAPMAGYQAQPTVTQVVQGGAQWQAPTTYNWQFDLNGNLLF